ncbi:hypothetical protein GQ55_2G428100 [Panicum hallii var. hallii]|uniref:Uncharacterized protein n=1 Tax=Panicum hallii var. hallii TaxID=1504633 RepID=A0A2T7EYE4_9POAL|nr:hypothetical protein GQ55_2G428100 [Panicum hallii var. hallii]
MDCSSLFRPQEGRVGRTGSQPHERLLPRGLAAVRLLPRLPRVFFPSRRASCRLPSSRGASGVLENSPMHAGQERRRRARWLPQAETTLGCGRRRRHTAVAAGVRRGRELGIRQRGRRAAVAAGVEAAKLARRRHRLCDGERRRGSAAGEPRAEARQYGRRALKVYLAR